MESFVKRVLRPSHVKRILSTIHASIALIVLLSGLATRVDAQTVAAANGGALAGVSTVYNSRGVIKSRPPLVPLRMKLPFIEGSSYEVLQGNEGGYTHQGLNRYAWDFGLPEGTPVCAVAQGRVVRVKQDSDVGGTSEKDYSRANTIVIDHGNGIFSQYLHLKQASATVAEGDVVKGGQVIARSGNTGFSSMPHLHFQVQDVTGQSLPTAFLDVPGDGVPAEGKAYASGNDGRGVTTYSGESRMPLGVFQVNKIELLKTDMPGHLLRTDRTYRLEGITRGAHRVVLYIMGPEGGRPVTAFVANVEADGRFRSEIKLDQLPAKIEKWSTKPGQSNSFALAMTTVNDDGSYWSEFSIPISVR